jgi:peptidoglycan/xylan/chitin deacetylase (PgdA/CDA1 family)
VNAPKATAKRAVLKAIARVAPLTWQWRAPGALVVLSYHRVLPLDSPLCQTEQPAMYVSPQTLDLHLTELKGHFELVHLDEWLRRARQRAPLPRLACAITFDDGWRDNFEFALPVLRRHGAPATIFPVSSYIGSAQRFWPNRLMGLLRKAFRNPGSVAFPQPLESLIEPVLEEARRRGELRAADLDRAVKEAKSFDETSVRDWVDEAERSCGGLAETRETLSGEEIGQLAATGLVRFGSHTVTHYRLGGQAPTETLEREIARSRDELRQICGQEIEVFCYPNGEMSPAAVAMVRQHYIGAVTTLKGWHRASADPHLVRRIPLYERVSNRPESFLARVSAWI